MYHVPLVISVYMYAVMEQVEMGMEKRGMRFLEGRRE